MLDVRVIEDPAAATVALDPVRSRLLSELREPASAATLAHRVGLPRQKVNYHLRTLEAHKLVRVTGRRRWGGLTERRLVATASAYVVSPSAMGPVAVDPERKMDRLAASYLIALAARAVREIGDLIRRAHDAGKHLATMSIDTVIRFRTPEDRAAFSQELAEAINHLVAKYHDESAPGGRSHRLVLLAHPLPKPSNQGEGESHARKKRQGRPPVRRGRSRSSRLA
jgi:DNA-binding transcriptional ArsR family regulator